MSQVEVLGGLGAVVGCKNHKKTLVFVGFSISSTFQGPCGTMSLQRAILIYETLIDPYCRLEDQEDKRGAKQLVGIPASCFKVPWSS